MEKLDFKKADKALYSGKVGRWDRINVPALWYLMIDGSGAPEGAEYGRAVAALYPLAYGVKFALKAEGRDFVVPPLEAVWRADDPAAFVAGRRAEWKWCAMLRVPDGVDSALLERVRAAAIAKLARKADPATDAATLGKVRLERYVEGDSFQTLHKGAYADEAPVLADLHEHVMPAAGVTFGKPHHEIYLSDPRRVAPEKLRTILRQPVLPL